jgi:hypothetical protein
LRAFFISPLWIFALGTQAMVCCNKLKWLYFCFKSMPELQLTVNDYLAAILIMAFDAGYQCCTRIGESSGGL